jgi:transposase-like protein
MFCPLWQREMRRFGKNRNGSQRYRCDGCKHTFTDAATRPSDKRRLCQEKAVLALRMLLEGNSIRSVERLLSIHRDTIMNTIVEVGERCQTFLETIVRQVSVTDVQADELWGFIFCKERTKERNEYGEEVGDAWCFTAIERTSKLVLAWHLGKRALHVPPSGAWWSLMRPPFRIRLLSVCASCPDGALSCAPVGSPDSAGPAHRASRPWPG